jgi:hypothetical protein
MAPAKVPLFRAATSRTSAHAAGSVALVHPLAWRKNPNTTSDTLICMAIQDATGPLSTMAPVNSPALLGATRWAEMLLGCVCWGRGQETGRGGDGDGVGDVLRTSQISRSQSQHQSRQSAHAFLGAKHS